MYKNHSAAMLAAKNSAGRTPEVNQRNPSSAGDETHKGGGLESQNRSPKQGYQWPPQEGLMSLNYYRPQTKFAKVMFLHQSVSHSVHGGVCLSACWDTPIQEQTPPRPGSPEEQTPPRPGTPPPGADPHLCSACWEIR